MKKNDFEQIKGLDIKDLMIKIVAIKAELPDLMLDKNMNKLKDFKVISKKRKDLAQISTVLRQKELLLEIESKLKSAVEVGVESLKQSTKTKKIATPRLTRGKLPRNDKNKRSKKI